jgi:hypothetical protein
MCPIGLHCHKAADRIALLEAVAEAAIEMRKCAMFVGSNHVDGAKTFDDALRAAGYLKEQGE